MMNEKIKHSEVEIIGRVSPAGHLILFHTF